jgi:hypothetical protein
VSLNGGIKEMEMEDRQGISKYGCYMITFFRIYRNKFALPEKSYYTIFMDQGIQYAGNHDYKKLKQRLLEGQYPNQNDGNS